MAAWSPTAGLISALEYWKRSCPEKIERRFVGCSARFLDTTFTMLFRLCPYLPVCLSLDLYVYVCLSVCLSVCPCIYPSICLPVDLYVYVCLSVHASTHPSVCLSIYMSMSVCPCIHPSVCLSIYMSMSVCLSMHPPIHLSAYRSICLCLSVCLSVHASTHPSVCLSIYMSVCLPACLFVCSSTFKEISQLFTASIIKFSRSSYEQFSYQNWIRLTVGLSIRATGYMPTPADKRTSNNTYYSW